MPKKPGAYHRPDSIAEALQLLSQPNSVILAGGTKLLANESGLSAEHVIDLQALGLNQIEAEEELLNVGATCTLQDLAVALNRDYPSDPASVLLQQVIRQEGPNTYRNAATVGGSIASRLPDSELLAALLVLGTRLNLAGVSANEGISLIAYLEGDYPQNGLISGLQIPWTHGQGATERVARTPADYPIVSIVAWQPSGGSVRLAATGIGSLPERLGAAEEYLSAGINENAITAAASAAKNAAHHPGDFRGDAAYRAQMAEVLTTRVLQKLGQ